MKAWVVSGRLEQEFEASVVADSEEEAMDMVEGGEVELDFITDSPSVYIEGCEEIEEAEDELQS